MEGLLMNKAQIIIEENENGDINVFADLEPPLTKAQQDGEEDVPMPHYITGVLLEALDHAITKIGMEHKVNSGS